MVKKTSNSTPKSSAKAKRHSKSTKAPVTIDVEAKKVEPPKPETAPRPEPSPALGRNAARNRPETVAGGGDRRTSTPKTAQTKNPTSAKTQPANPGFFSKLGAGFAGGFIALIGAAGLQYFGYLPSMNAQTDGEQKRAALESRLVELEHSVASRPEGPAFDPLVLEVKIAEKLAALQETAQNASSGDAQTAALATQAALDNLKSLITANSEKVSDLGNQVTSSNETLTDLQSALSSGSAGEQAGLAAISNRLDAFEATLSALENEQPGDNATNTTNEQANIETSIASLRKELALLSSQTANLPQSFVDQESIDARFTGMKDQLTTSSDRLASLEADIVAQNTALEDIRNRVENGAEKQTARALAATALKDRIDRGLPFTNALQTLKSLVDDASSLEPLEPFAQSGVPSMADLANKFDAVRPSALAATMPAPEQDTLSRLLASAKSIVTVKDLNEITGDGIGAKLSQISAALKSGQSEKSEALWQSLPDAAKQSTSNWHERFAARLKADNLLSQTVQNFLSDSTSQ